jgi:FixJ family two-component response regulator
VYVVDDDAAVRNAVALLLKSVGLEVKKFESAAAFLEGFEPRGAGCVVLDVRMPGVSGLELHRLMKERGWSVPVVFMSGHGDIDMAVSAMKAGAFDFIEKPFRDQELIDRVNQALASRPERSDAASELATLRARETALTPREREVMRLIVEGRANKVIAADLGLSERTVEVHRARVMEKMEAHSLAALVRSAVKLGY